MPPKKSWRTPIQHPDVPTFAFLTLPPTMEAHRRVLEVTVPFVEVSCLQRLEGYKLRRRRSARADQTTRDEVRPPGLPALLDPRAPELDGRRQRRRRSFGSRLRWLLVKVKSEMSRHQELDRRSWSIPLTRASHLGYLFLTHSHFLLECRFYLSSAFGFGPS